MNDLVQGEVKIMTEILMSIKHLNEGNAVTRTFMATLAVHTSVTCSSLTASGKIIWVNKKKEM